MNIFFFLFIAALIKANDFHTSESFTKRSSSSRSNNLYNSKFSDNIENYSEISEENLRSDKFSNSNSNNNEPNFYDSISDVLYKEDNNNKLGVGDNR